MRKHVVLALFTMVLVMGLASAASAQQCTASLNCNNGCWLEKICTSPYPPCELFCSAPSQTISCTGTSTCSVGSGSVTCDGVTTSCPTGSRCFEGLYYIRCGSITRQCTYNCPL
ncbi:MAG TPA: hypothetical protein VGX68_07225 [Thermoanaerobaculia bacterium]|jgi:hypothetical protein|nr:hypothetical protein [Thermoanaerobaculia bacterium]